MNDLAKRFWAKVEKSNNCWEWRGAKSGKGYGVIRPNRRRINLYAHRVAWELVHGPIPKGMLVCHHCDNPGCVRPQHLFIGTQQDNVDDMKSKGRGNIGERHGMSKFTPGIVIAMRAYKETLTYEQLASLFGASYSGVYQVVTGRRWTHI